MLHLVRRLVLGVLVLFFLSFYLQSVMVIAHDENLGGEGASNPQQDFAGVKIDPTVNPTAAFGLDPSTSGAVAQPTAVDLLS